MWRTHMGIIMFAVIIGPCFIGLQPPIFNAVTVGGPILMESWCCRDRTEHIPLAKGILHGAVNNPGPVSITGDTELLAE